MDELKQLVVVILIFINGGGILRGIYCFIRITANPDEMSSYVKKIVHVIIFLILANSALMLMLTIKTYYI